MSHTVWLASYPKSGNTWLRALLSALRHEDGEFDINRLGQGPIASGRPHLEQYTGLIASDLTLDELATLRPMVDRALDAELDETRFRKIHDTLFSGRNGAPIVPPDATLGTVYLIRDPRDVAVSLAHHLGRPLETIVEWMSNPGFALDRADQMIRPQVYQRLDTWSNHVRSWVDQTLFPVVVVRYEDLHTAPAEQLARVAELGELVATREEIDAAVAATGFTQLREQEERSGFGERSGAERIFFRRGVAGAWREELPPKLAARIERDHGETMERFGYTSDQRSNATSVA